MPQYEIIISRFAEDDLKEIIAYYAETDSKYAKKLFVRIRNKINGLNGFPGRGKIVPELEKQGILKYRQILEGNYRIIYTVKEREIRILIIVDSRRNLEEVLMNKLMGMSGNE